MPKITTLELNMPVEFPITQYESVHKIISSSYASHSLYGHFAGAWNALAYRFRAFIDYGDILVKSFNSVPSYEYRYIQERTLFNFFNSGYSVFESTFYGLYTIGAFLEPKDFPLSTKKNQREVTPKFTKNAFAKLFPADPILTDFQNILSDVKYKQWQEIRNVLTHRTAPGRIFRVTTGKKDVLPPIWKLNNKPLDDSIPTRGKQELSRLLTDLLDASDNFVHRQFKKK